MHHSFHLPSPAGDDSFVRVTNFNVMNNMRTENKFDANLNCIVLAVATWPFSLLLFC